MNKRGSGAGDIVEMVPVLVLVSAIAVVIFGVSSVYYAYDISVRDAESLLLGRAIVECLFPEGVLNLDNIKEEDRSFILRHCGIEESERIYVGVEVDSDARKVYLKDGDEGLLWVRDLFEKVVVTGNAVSGWNNENVERIAKYNPGYFSDEYKAFVFENGVTRDGFVKVEVLINYEK